MRDMGTWLEEDNIYRPQERPIKKEDDKYIVHGHEYPIDEVEKDEFGTLLLSMMERKRLLGLRLMARLWKVSIL